RTCSPRSGCCSGWACRSRGWPRRPRRPGALRGGWSPCRIRAGGWCWSTTPIPTTRWRACSTPSAPPPAARRASSASSGAAAAERRGGHRGQGARGLPDHRDREAKLRRPGRGAARAGGVAVSARFSAAQAAWAAGAQLLSGAPGQVFEGVVTDSRAPVRGALFVALVGERHDGSVFAAAAAPAGAAGVLVPSVSATRVREELAAQGLRPAILAGPDTGRALGGLAHAWRQSLPGVRVVCVTGSTGKTSTKELVAAVLETAGPTLKTEGNLNNEVGV